MPRWVLRYRGEGSIPERVAQEIGASKGVCVVDRSARMLVVEGDERAVRSLAERLGSWAVAPEDTRYRVPDPRKSTR